MIERRIIIKQPRGSREPKCARDLTTFCTRTKLYDKTYSDRYTEAGPDAAAYASKFLTVHARETSGTRRAAQWIGRLTYSGKSSREERMS